MVSEQNEVPPTRPALSRHSIRHLGLDRRTAKEPQAAAVNEMETPTLEELTEETLKILFWRMKNDPAGIKTNELVPFAIQALRTMEAKGQKKTNLAEMLGQLSDARANAEG